jgi:hypothetical protein
MVFLDISFRVTDERHRISVSNHITKYHPPAFEHPSFDTCFYVSLIPCRVRLAKVLHIGKGSSRMFLHCSSFTLAAISVFHGYYFM